MSIGVGALSTFDLLTRTAATNFEDAIGRFRIGSVQDRPDSGGGVRFAVSEAVGSNPLCPWLSRRPDALLHRKQGGRRFTSLCSISCRTPRDDRARKPLAKGCSVIVASAFFRTKRHT